MRHLDVRFIIELAESGSIRAAAERLGKTQSALTKQLKKMETELGVSLFRRTSRGIFPTEIGQSLLVRARSIDAEMQRFRQEVSAYQGLQTGSLKISASPLPAVNVIPRAIRRFLRPVCYQNFPKGLLPIPV